MTARAANSHGNSGVRAVNVVGDRRGESVVWDAGREPLDRTQADITSWTEPSTECGKRHLVVGVVVADVWPTDIRRVQHQIESPSTRPLQIGSDPSALKMLELPITSVFGVDARRRPARPIGAAMGGLVLSSGGPASLLC